jgi:hypothetical protein
MGRDTPREQLATRRFGLRCGILKVGADRLVQKATHLVKRTTLHGQIQIQAQTFPTVVTSTRYAEELSIHVRSHAVNLRRVASALNGSRHCAPLVLRPQSIVPTRHEIQIPAITQHLQLLADFLSDVAVPRVEPT